MSQVVVVVGGGALSARAVAAVLPGATIVAADSGLDHALAAGLTPHRLVGDLDSVSVAGRAWAEANRVPVEEHPVAKDLTDAELAISGAAAMPGAGDLLLLGGVGDRLDHLLGILLALGHPMLAGLTSVRAVIGATELVVVHPGHRVELALRPGQTFSLLALHGACHGITLTGAEWSLADADLSPTEARGLSNRAKEHVMLSTISGVVTAVVP